MVITYHSGACFKISQGDLTLAINPPSKDSSFKVSKFGSDIVLSSLNNEDFNGTDTASLGDKKPFTITGPGEYDVKGVTVLGFASETAYGLPAQAGRKHLNTIYSIKLEGVSLCFLGAFEGTDLPHDAKQALDEVDILFVPIGGNGALDYSAANKLAVQLEAKIVIPSLFTEKDLKAFLKEAGAEDVKPAEKLTLKKKDLEGKEGEIVVLSEA